MKTVSQSENKLGIDNLKPVVDFLGATVTAVIDADENNDGKVSLLEAARVAPSVMIRLFGLFQKLKAAGQEIKDLTPDEIEDLIKTLGKALKLKKDDANEVLQKWFEWAAATVDLVEQTAKLRKTTA
jgi:Glu-tRNA(Gln) amidotransferase subunit E-like FAD-binding protein